MTHNYFVFGILFVFFLISILAFSQDASSVASNVSTATVKNTDATIHLATSDLDFDNLSYTFNNPNNGTIVQYGKKTMALTVALDASTTYY
mgnify:CR=1 FL=1|tara:strand:+ start:1041 stop:1313 length:273 start_codon:yes stop_codon:yes gene_type:complete